MGECSTILARPLEVIILSVKGYNYKDIVIDRTGIDLWKP